MTETINVRFLDAIKPDVSQAAAKQVLHDAYDISAELTALDSERDLNFRATTPAGDHYLLKISNHEEPLEIIEFENAALQHIARVDPGLPVPRLHRTRDDLDVGYVLATNAYRHTVRLLTFLPGTVLSRVARTDALVFQQGKMAARMALATQGFFHPAAGKRHLLWDVREVGSLAPIAGKITDANVRNLILQSIENFQQTVKPQLAALRAQIGHMDLTRYNMVVDAQAPEQVSGIIDFGDMHHGPLALDVGIALADVMVPDPDPITKAQVFLRGYQHILSLQDREIALLYDIVIIYLVASYLILLRRDGTSEQADNSEQREAVAMIEEMQRVGRDRMYDLFSQACGHPRPREIEAGDVAALIARRKVVMGDALYVFYDPPLNLVRGDGVWLYDSAGKVYLDAYNNVPVVGHAHPYVTQAVTRQMQRLNTNTRYICDEIIAYAERLTNTMPDLLSNTFFVNSGSEANDLAWLMATAYTGNAGAIIIEDAYHGWTHAVAALSPPGIAGLPPANHVRTVPAPDRYFGAEDSSDALLARCARQVDEAIASLAEAGLRPALCIVDPAFCSNGILEPLPGFLPMLFEKVRHAGGLCVADEVQSGFGRLGRHMWGFELHKVVPDIVTIGKPMANGYPMGAVITRPEILAAVSKDSAVFATFGGSNVAAAAASAVLDVFFHDELLQNSSITGQYFRKGLQQLASQHDIIGDVRSRGLMLGVELVLDRRSKTPAVEASSRVLQMLSEAGVLLGSDGPRANVLKIRPPLVFTREHADLLLMQLDRVLERL